MSMGNDGGPLGFCRCEKFACGGVVGSNFGILSSIWMMTTPPSRSDEPGAVVL